ncbi:MAG TPA: class I SAM-dependent methyltransferase [Solirubrobacterales bacterium]
MARDDYYASAFGKIFSAYMERPRLSRAIGWALWGGDVKRYYESMAAIAEVSAGGTVVDCPCGAGPAFRAAPASVRYVAVDLSPSMLRRARKRAAARNLAGVELVQADATDLPLPPASADLFLSYWGLHCFPEPAAALLEAARVLRPDGRLVGVALVRGQDSLRQRLIQPGRGDFGRPGTQAEIETWLTDAGFDPTDIDRSGPMLFFDAHKGRRGIGSEL